MKIAFVFDDSLDRPDGVQQAILTTGEWMKSEGHDVHYIVGHTERDDIENVHSMARSWRVKFNGNTLNTPLPTSKSKIKQFLNKEKFDVLHVQMPYSPFFAARVIHAAPVTTKIVGTFHILPYSKGARVATKQLGRILKSSIKKFDHFVSVSEPAAVFAKATFGIDSVVIPNPVDVSRFASKQKTKSDSRKKIVFLGRLENRKGIIELVQAYESAAEADPKFKKSTELVIGGKGPLKDKVHSMLLDLPRDCSAKMIGFVPEGDKAALLASAHVAVFPSVSGESFGIILVEAMASGARLVIAGNNPGYSSVLGEMPELLVNPKDIDAFAKKLLWANKESSDVAAYSKWLHEQASRYDVASVGNQLIELYNS